MRILASLSLMFILSCSPGQTEKRGRDCSVAPDSSGGQIISCDDGTENAIPKQQSCRAEALHPENPSEGGVIISCPPTFEPIVIDSGLEGTEGTSCVLEKIEARDEKVLVCNGKKIIVGR